MPNPSPTTYALPEGVVRAGRWDHAIAQFAATVQPGQCLEFTCPSLNTVDGSGARPFDQNAEAHAAAAAVGESALKLLDWASSFDLDPVTQRFYTAGGREISVPECNKIVWYDARTNTWDSRGNWSGRGAGHLYRSTTVLPGPRRVVNGQSSLMGSWNIDTDDYAADIAMAPNIGDRTASWSVPKCLVWHPNMGPQGSIVWANDSWDRILCFDWATQAWSHIATGWTLGGSASIWDNNQVVGHYHPMTDTAIVGASYSGFRGRPVVVRADKSVFLASVAPCDLTCAGSNGSVFVPHPWRAASISFCYTTKRIWSYEYDTDTWVDRAPIPTPFNNRVSIGGTLHQLGVILNVVYGSAGASKMWVYRPGF